MISARLCIVYSHHLKISSSIGTLLCESINTHTLIHAHDGNMCVCLIDFQISEHGECALVGISSVYIVSVIEKQKERTKTIFMMHISSKNLFCSN